MGDEWYKEGYDMGDMADALTDTGMNELCEGCGMDPERCLCDYEDYEEAVTQAWLASMKPLVNTETSDE